MALTSFVGRHAELAELRRLVGEHRLVTLTGAGGVGKTRLAARLAGELAGERAHAPVDGVWWVDLAPLTDPALVAVQVARTLGLPDQPDRSPTETVTRFIGARPAVLVLDNCEHLLDGCAGLVTALLEACPELRLVATSREPLGVAGERTWLTPSLALGDEAVTLFTDRARLARPDLVVAGDDAAVVVEICRRLDGVALAIELAAARVRVLSLGEILDGLRNRFALLTGGARTALPRQQTLRASVDWSHALLSEPEQAVFRRLAVFPGGFDLDAACAVAGDAGPSRCQVHDQLASLVDKSLVVAEATGCGTRYRLLETMRDYASEKLDESGETARTRRRHRDHYLALFGSPAAVDHQHRVDQALVEIDNLRAAFAWSRDQGEPDPAAQLASALQPLWLTRGRVREGLAWFDAVLADGPAPAPAVRAAALADKLILDHLAGAFDRAALAEEALTIARRLDDPVLLAWVLAACGVTWIFFPDVATPYFEEAIAILRARDDTWQLSWVLGWRADCAYVAGDPAAAAAAAAQGRELADATGDAVLARMCSWFAGCAHWLSADLAAADARFRDVVARARRDGDPLWQAYGLFFVSKTAAHRGDTKTAWSTARAGVQAAADLAAPQQALSLGAVAGAALAAGDVAAAVAACDAAWRACPQPFLAAVNGVPTAEVALADGDLAAARRWADESVAAASGAHRMILLATRVRVAIAEDDPQRARHDARDALAIAAEQQAYLRIPDVIECLAVLAARSGAHREAARLFGAAHAVRDHTGQIRYRVYDAEHAATVAHLRKAMTETEFQSRWAEGAALSPAEAVARARRAQGGHKRPPSGWQALTPAEREVVLLAGEGLGNKEIAARLFVSPRTVQSHLTHVYAKLGIDSRVRLVEEVARHR